MARLHPGSLHGEQVGVATLTLSRLQNALLRAERPPEVRATRLDEAAMRARYGAALADGVIAAFRAKALDDAAAARMNARLAEVWPTMSARIREIMLPTARLREALLAAGAPTRAWTSACRPGSIAQPYAMRARSGTGIRSSIWPAMPAYSRRSRRRRVEVARIVVLGAGLAGSAFCVPLADQGHEVNLVGTPSTGRSSRRSRARLSSSARGAPAAVGDAAAS